MLSVSDQISRRPRDTLDIRLPEELRVKRLP
jgi:hypothetical protein